MTLVLQDQGVSGGPAQEPCARGQPCRVQLSGSELVVLAAADLWPVGKTPVLILGTSCSACAQLGAGSNFLAQTQLSLDYTADFDFDSSPGQYLVCLCEASEPINPNASEQSGRRLQQTASGKAVAGLVVEGVDGGQEATCFRGQVCCLPQLKGEGLKAGDAVTVQQVCGESKLLENLPGSGIATDAFGNGNYSFGPGETNLLLSAAGVFNLCWCRPSSENNCTSGPDFNVQVGFFRVQGPLSTGQFECTMNSSCSFTLGGIGLKKYDKVIVSRNCADDSSELGALNSIATTLSDDGSFYDLGLLPLTADIWHDLQARCSKLVGLTPFALIAKLEHSLSILMYIYIYYIMHFMYYRHVSMASAACATRVHQGHSTSL